jgi:hypothetical protein
MNKNGKSGQQAPDAVALLRVLHLKVNALEAGLKKLVEIRTGDITNIQQAFVFTDAHIYVLKTLCQDIVKGDVFKLPDGAVDMDAYYGAYKIWREGEMKRVGEEELARQAADQAQPETPEDEGAEADDQDEDATYFEGGVNVPSQS